MKNPLSFILIAIIYIIANIPFSLNAQNQITRKQNGQSLKSQNFSSKSKVRNPTPISAPELDFDTIFVNGEIIEMVTVEGGEFTMGTNKKSPYDTDLIVGYPAHKESVSTFKISKYVVTEKLWKIVMGNNTKSKLGDNYPVDCSWNDAAKFISKLNDITGKHFRLPSEKEWEYAAKGGMYSKGYRYAGSNNLNDVGWHGGDDFQPVGNKRPNELGLYDMSGNIFEWCNENSKSGYKILKGGAYSFYAFYAEPSSKMFHSTDGSSSYYSGFRLVMDISNSSQIIITHSESEINMYFERGKNYELGINGCAKSTKDAKYWYEKAASEGHPEALANLAIWYFYGINVIKDERKGIQYMQSAIDKGFNDDKKYLNEMLRLSNK